MQEKLMHWNKWLIEEYEKGLAWFDISAEEWRKKAVTVGKRRFAEGVGG